MKPRTKVLVESAIDGAVALYMLAAGICYLLNEQWGYAALVGAVASLFVYNIVRRERMWRRGKYEKRVVVDVPLPAQPEGER